MIVLLREVFLVVSEEGVKLNALLEVLDCLHTSDLPQEIEVAVDVYTSSDESLPVHTLKLNVGVVLLELEVDRLVEVDVWSLDRVLVVSRHFELVKVKVLREHLHIYQGSIIIFIN